MEKLLKIIMVVCCVFISSAYAEESDDIEHEIEYELGRQLEELDVEIAEGSPNVTADEDTSSLAELKQTEMSNEDKEAYKQEVAQELEQKVQKKQARRARKKARRKRLAAKKRYRNKGRRPASVAFKQGFKRLRRNCSMFSKANGRSARVLRLKKGKKLWVEGHGKWMKAFRKKGAGYIDASCF